MPSNKIYTTLVLCIGLVVSIWLIQRPPENSPAKENLGGVSVSTYKNTEGITASNDDWKKILVSVDPKTQGITEDLTAKNSSIFDDTTLTAQMSKDFFSQYLLLKKGGNALTADDISKITNNISSSAVYSTKGVTYVAGNLHVINKADKETIKKYQDIVNLILKTRSNQIRENPVLLLNSSINSQGANQLPKLDSIVKIGQEFIGDLLNVEVPLSAVTPHLALLNSISAVVSDLEGMRELYTDPIKALSSITQYNQDITNFQTSLNNLNVYFTQKLPL